MTRARTDKHRDRTRGKHPVAWGILGLMCCVVSSCGEPETPSTNGAKGKGASPDRPNILLIVVDTLRRDHLSCYGHPVNTSPAIDALAAKSVVYNRAYAQAPWTTPSLAALLSSRYPTALGIKGDRSALSPDLVLLPEVLQEAGYETAAVVSHSFCSSRWGFDQGFNAFDETNVLGHAAVTSEGVSDQGLAFLQTQEDAQAPWFLWLHYFDPHCAYIEQEGSPTPANDYAGLVKSGQLYRELWQARRDLTEDDYSELRRLYDSEIRHTDEHIGRVLDHLERTGAMDNTIIVFTADHGEEFGDHGSIGHARTLHEELIVVPLIAHIPGIAPTTVEQPVALIDVYPTLLSTLGLPPQQGMEGRDIRPGSAQIDQPRVIFSETNRGGKLRAAISGNLKIVTRGRFGQLTAFDLENDPTEAKPLDNRQHAGVLALAPLLAQWGERMRAEAIPEHTVDLTGDDRSQLEQLGYGGDDEETPRRGRKRKD